jgi:hypothetical protein
MNSKYSLVGEHYVQPAFHGFSVLTQIKYAQVTVGKNVSMVLGENTVLLYGCKLTAVQLNIHYISA